MFTKLVRIGRDAEMKYLPSGTAILEMSVVYDVGFGDKKQSQWVKLAMFGQRAEKLVQHFKKGSQIVATMDDVKAECWLKDGEAKCAISAKLVDFDFAGSGQQQGSQQAAPQQSAPQQAPAYQQAAPQMAPAYQQSNQQAAAPQQQQQQQQQGAQSWGNAPAQNAPAQRPTQQTPVPNNPATGQDPAMDFDDDIAF